MNRGLGPPIRVLHIGRYGGVAGPQPLKRIRQYRRRRASSRGSSVWPSQLRSKVRESRGQGRQPRVCGGRSKAKRLERATREPHNRLRRPIEVDTDSLLDTSYIPRGSLGWFVQLRQRQRGVSDHICGRGRVRRLGQISWSLTPRLPSVSSRRAAWRLPCGRRRRPDFPLRNN